jgi:glutaminyl-tRNA synthetase
VSAEEAGGSDFIRQKIRGDLASGRHSGVVTRFPPEPNGYLHVGHASPICLNFGVAEEFGGHCFLRFDDTNPLAESSEFVEGMQADIRWLGFDWGKHLSFASDYFEQMYGFAVQLIEREKAFVCDLSSEEIEARRGTLTEPGTESPYRNRSVEENLDLFTRMRAGEFEPGERTLRAKIDMASPVLPNRDPLLYRILKATHHRTGDAWCIYPLYDFAHCLEDALEKVTHSLCTLEFSDHRPLYDWILDNVDAVAGPSRPEQTEFARFDLTHTVMSKRLLRRLVEEGLVAGWDDPRLPTLRGLRRRGYTPASIRNLMASVSVTRRETVIQLAQLEAACREDLNRTSPRAMAVLDPLRVVIDNYPEEQTEELEAINNPEDPSAGTRKVPFSRVLYIEREDFLEDPPKKFFRLAPGREVRLRYAYFITCNEVVKDASGEVVELRCSYDPETRGGDAPDGRKVKGTLHWVSAPHAIEAEVRLYDVLFSAEDPTASSPAEDLLAKLNPDSLRSVEGWLEPSLVGAPSGSRFQFERLGYFCVDADTSADRVVVNRTVTLRNTWAKQRPK